MRECRRSCNASPPVLVPAQGRKRDSDHVDVLNVLFLGLRMWEGARRQTERELRMIFMYGVCPRPVTRGGASR